MMTEAKAIQEGLEFTGIYSSDKQEVKDRISRERSNRPGARIRLVRSPASKLSRSHSNGGYSGYADKVYFAYDRVRGAQGVIDNHDAAVESIRQNFQQAMLEQNTKYAQAQEKLHEAQNVIDAARTEEVA